MTDLDKLIEKYKAAETSLEEEAYLKENAKDLESQTWFDYLKKSKIQVDSKLKDDIWQTIYKRRNNNRLKIFSAAAAIAFIVLFSISYFKPREQSFEEKVALLQEAKAMFSNELPPYNVIYEDELVIIYTEQ